MPEATLLRAACGGRILLLSRAENWLAAFACALTFWLEKVQGRGCDAATIISLAH